MTNLNILNRRLCLLVVAAMTTCAWAQEQAKPAVTSQLHKAEATVEAIDPSTRVVSLSGPKGPLTVVVGPDARNFDKVHVGDKVVVSYYQGFAAQMARGDTKVTEPAVSTFDYRAQGGGRPGGGVGASATTTVIIEDIDPATNTVAFKRQDGAVRIIEVKSPNMQQFVRTLKRGDSVEVTYTESIAVDVVPAKSREAQAPAR